MKKLIILLFALLFTACGRANENKDVSMENGKLNVYASVYPVYDLTKKIGGDKINLSMLVKPGEEAHHYEPSTDDIKNLSKADLFIYNGSGLESWTEKVLSSMPELKSLEASENVDLIVSDHDHDHEHDHDHNHDEENHKHNHEANEVDSHNESQNHEDEHEHGDESTHHHGSYDPHTWLSLKNAKIELENIKNKLSEIDKENASYYEDNFKTYADKLDELDKRYEETLKNAKTKTFVVTHEAFGYLCRDYNLKQLPIKNVNNSGEPDPKTMAQIIDFIKANNIKYICAEDMVNTKIAETIKAETGAEIVILSPLESLNEDQIKNNEDYLSVMEENLRVLNEVLNWQKKFYV